MKKWSFSVLSAMVTIIVFSTCTRDRTTVDYTTKGYPQEVGEIIVAKCATAGCHNDISKDAAGGLSLETWDKLFQGARSGSVIIPYRPDFSTLIYATNSYYGFNSTSITPTMPANDAPLSVNEMYVLHQWILAGAPNADGFVKFSDHQNNKKLYVANKECDVVTVMDPASGLAMRYIDVGTAMNIETPNMVRVSPDNVYWYVVFNSGTVIQRFRTSDNSEAGSINIGPGIWTSFAFTSDSRKAFITDTQFGGRILCVDLENMQIITNYQAGLIDPFDVLVNAANNKLYVAPQTGNYIYKIDISNIISPVITEISLETGMPVNYLSSLDPYSILLSNDGSKYFVACKTSSELRIIQTSNDSLLATISVGSNVSRMVSSTTTPYLFVSCQGAVPFRESAIYVIDHQTNSYVTDLYAGYDSRGITLDEITGKLFVANRNVSTGGPAAHHESVCAGKNGYVTAIDLNTLQLIQGYKAEVSVDPFDIGISR